MKATTVRLPDKDYEEANQILKTFGFVSFSQYVRFSILETNKRLSENG